MLDSDEEITDAFRQQFFPENPRPINWDRIDEISQQPERSWPEFSYTELASVLVNTQNSTAPGPDHVTWRHWKEVIALERRVGPDAITVEVGAVPDSIPRAVVGQGNAVEGGHRLADAGACGKGGGGSPLVKAHILDVRDVIVRLDLFEGRSSEVDTHDRPDTSDFHQCATADVLQALAQFVAGGMELLGSIGREDLLETNSAGCHGQDVVVEGAGMLDGVCMTRIEDVHDVSLAAECA